MTDHELMLAHHALVGEWMERATAYARRCEILEKAFNQIESQFLSNPSLMDYVPILQNIINIVHKTKKIFDIVCS